jgi:hypothetical protein
LSRRDSGRRAEADQEFDLVAVGQLVFVLKDDRLAAVAVVADQSTRAKSGRIPMSIAGEEDDIYRIRRMDRASYRRRVRDRRRAASAKV